MTHVLCLEDVLQPFQSMRRPENSADRQKGRDLIHGASLGHSIVALCVGT